MSRLLTPVSRNLGGCRLSETITNRVFALVVALCALFSFSCGSGDPPTASPGHTDAFVSAARKEEVLKRVQDSFASLDHSSRQREVEQIAALLASFPEVQDVSIGDLSVWANFSDGERFFVLNNQSAAAGTGKEIAPERPASSKALVGPNAVIIEALGLQGGFNNIPENLDSISAMLKQKGYQVKRLAGTLENMLGPIQDIDVMIFSGHGGVDPRYKEFLLASTTSSPIFLDPPKPAGSKHLVGLVRSVEEYGGLVRGFALPPSVIASAWSFRRDSLTFFSACESGTPEAVNGLHKLFTVNGGTVFGWSANAAIKETAVTQDVLFQLLLAVPTRDGEDSIPKNFREAFGFLAGTPRPGTPRTLAETTNAGGTKAVLVLSPSIPPENFLVPQLLQITRPAQDRAELTGFFKHDQFDGPESRKVVLSQEGRVDQELFLIEDEDEKLTAIIGAGIDSGTLKVVVDERVGNRMKLPPVLIGPPPPPPVIGNGYFTNNCTGNFTYTSPALTGEDGSGNTVSLPPIHETLGCTFELDWRRNNRLNVNLRFAPGKGPRYNRGGIDNTGTLIVGVAGGLTARTGPDPGVNIPGTFQAIRLGADTRDVWNVELVGTGSLLPTNCSVNGTITVEEFHAGSVGGYFGTFQCSGQGVDPTL